METPAKSINAITDSINTSPFAGQSLLPESNTEAIALSDINDIESLIDKAKKDTKVTYKTYINFFFPKIFQYLLCFMACVVHYFLPLRFIRSLSFIAFGLLIILCIVFFVLSCTKVVPFSSRGSLSIYIALCAVFAVSISCVILHLNNLISPLLSYTCPVYVV